MDAFHSGAHPMIDQILEQMLCLEDADQRAQTVLWSMVHGYAQLVASGTLKAETMNGLDVLDVLPQFHDSGPDQTQ